MRLLRSPGPRCALGLAALALAPSRATGEETILMYQRATQTTALRPAAQGGNAVTDSTRAEILIALGDHRFAVYEPNQVWLYDFSARRVRRVDTRRLTYSDWSLHAFVAFNEMELASRLALRARMMAARPGPGPSVLDLEALFSMGASDRPGRGESLADSSHAGHTRFYTHRALSVDAVPTDTAFAPGRAAMFGRFLAFQAHLHPEARRAVVKSGRIARQLFYRYRDYNDETQVRMNLTRVSSAPEANDPTAMSERADVDDPAYRELNARLAACRRCAELGDWVEASRRFEATALDSGRTLDAALARIERTLGACEPEGPWPAALEGGAADSAIAACRLGLVWNDSASAVAALDQMDRVNGAGLERGYVLDYLRGRARLALGDLQTGAYMMMGGLGGNPCMAGAWLDLAQGYLRSLQPVLAWICYEAAERVTPGACGTRLAEKAAMERALEKRRPEFFE